jgi:hypothetical protein
MRVIRAIVLALPQVDTFAHFVGASFYFAAVFGPERERVGSWDRGARKRFDPREQYGNNLGRKPSQMIPNDPKSALH